MAHLDMILSTVNMCKGYRLLYLFDMPVEM